MQPRIRRFLDLRPGEGWPLAACAAYVGLAVASFTLAKPIRNGLFLDEFGAYKLVYVFVGVPLVLAAFIPVYNAIAARVGQRKVITGSLVFLAATVVLFWWAFRFHRAPWHSAAFYIWVNCYGVIAPVQAWTFANTVFDTRQARRLFGLVGAGASLGGILAGFMARTLVAPLGTVNLLLVLAALIAAAAVVVNAAWRVRRSDLRPPSRHARPLHETLRTIAGTRYLRLIATLIVLVAIVTQWTQFQFNLVVEAMFAGLPDKADRITAFNGTFNFGLGIVALLVQLLLTGPALRRYGMAFTILLLPAALGFGSALVFLWPLAWSVLLTNAFDQGLRFSVDKATFELLYMPVDARIKSDVKSAIDLVINRVADAVGGLVLGIATKGFSLVVFALPGFGLGLRGVAALALAGIGCWAFVAIQLRKGYVERLRDEVNQNRLEIERGTTTGLLDKDALDLLAGKMRSPDTKDILFALDVFEAQHGTTVHPAMRDLIRHPEPRVRERALELLDEAGDLTVVPQVEGLLRDPDLGTRTAALLYLAHHTGVDPLRSIEDLGPFPEFSVTAGIVAFWSRPGPTQNLDAARVLLEQLLETDGEQAERGRLEAARLLGRLGTHFPDLLGRLVADADAGVAREAALAAGRRGDATLAAALVARLAEPTVRPAAAEALVALGDAAVPALAQALNDRHAPPAARDGIPGVLADIATASAQEALLGALIQPQPQIRARVIESLNALRGTHPELPLDQVALEAVLTAELIGVYRDYQTYARLQASLGRVGSNIDGSLESIRQSSRRIFWLISLLRPDRDMEAVWVALEKGSGAVKANALELLDATLSPGLRRLAVPLFDGAVSVEERVGRANELLGVELSSDAEAVATLLSSEDPDLKAWGAYSVGLLRLLEFEDDLERLLEDRNRLLRETARVALMQMRAPTQPPQPVALSHADAAWEAHHGESGVG
jgi:AAA family ATP:ADP antiporter